MSRRRTGTDLIKEHARRVARLLSASPSRVVLAYALSGALWILLTDRIVIRIFDGEHAAAIVQSLKGLVFIGITSIFLHVLVATYGRQLQRQQQEINAHRRMDSLGALAATLAHEFRNVLMAARTHLSIVERRSDPAIAEPLERIRESLLRGERLTTEILLFGRPLSARADEIDLLSWMTTFAKDAEPLAAPASLELRLDIGPVVLRGDRGMLHRALSNLVINARDAGAIHIAIDVTGEEHLEITVIDDGAGMPEDIRARALEPLFSTKRMGTGLGLPIVHQITQAHGGTLSVESEPGLGTRVTMRLPRTEPAMGA